MSEAFQERRRSPRVAAGGGHTFTLGRRIRVRVLDVSANGALLASEEPLPVGMSGRLQLALGDARFEGAVRIVREQPGSSGAGHTAGAAVVPAEPRHQEALDGFLRRAGN